MNFKANTVISTAPSARSTTWLFSWPLTVGMLVYVGLLARGDSLLWEDDTYWHVATGQWIFQHHAIPTRDPFSHTMLGAPWTAHEWLSEVLMAGAYDMLGWTGVVALTAFAFALALGLLTRTLLKNIEPIYALLFAALAVAMTATHMHARPHILAMPLMMIWIIGLVSASESDKSPSLWLLPVMTVWANLHGGFTLGLALTFAFALEAALNSRANKCLANTIRQWAFFITTAIGSSLITPQGVHGIYFTWHIMFDQKYALDVISEWQSPNFHFFQPLEFWLLGGLALVLHQGLRLPPIRLLLLLGLLHLSLKHARNIELLGFLAPLFIATPFSTQWRQRQKPQNNSEQLDRFFRKLAQPAGNMAILVICGISMLLTQWFVKTDPAQPPDSTSLSISLKLIRQAGISGPVLNFSPWGGYLIFHGVPPFIDGRSDMYKDDFYKTYIEALTLTDSVGFEKLTNRYQVEWTLLKPSVPAIALLDHLPSWKRLYADKNVVVHVRTQPYQPVVSEADKPPIGDLKVDGQPTVSGSMRSSASPTAEVTGSGALRPTPADT